MRKLNEHAILVVPWSVFEIGQISILVRSRDNLILSCAYLTAILMDNKLVTFSGCHKNNPVSVIYVQQSSNATQMATRKTMAAANYKGGHTHQFNKHSKHIHQWPAPYPLRFSNVSKKWEYANSVNFIFGMQVTDWRSSWLKVGGQ